MRNIEIMLNDGMLGQKSLLVALSCLTTGNLNSKLKKEADPYRMSDVLPMAHDYIVPPLTEEEKREQVSRSLANFMKTAPNAPKFEGD
jgi:hypothetical protein